MGCGGLLEAGEGQLPAHAYIHVPVTGNILIMLLIERVAS